MEEVRVPEKRLSDYRAIIGASAFSEILALASKLKGKRIAHVNATAYGGGGYGVPSPGFAPAPGRGRSRTRDLDDRYDEEVGHGGHNPFGDDAASSLRGVSPRPVEQQQREHQSKANVGSNENSPSERRSMFTENV